MSKNYKMELIEPKTSSTWIDDIDINFPLLKRIEKGIKDD